MQRKNNLLMRTSKRNAMAMIMAIMVIVIIGTIMALSVAMTAETGKRTKELYLYEQVVLMSKSATEYALLRIAQNNPCTDINATFIQDTYYTIDIGAQYVYYNDPTTVGVDEAQAVCDAVPIATRGILYTTVSTPEQNGSVMLDITVSVTDTTISSEPIRYFRRTIQKL
ncbi:MAG: hypothetical protein JXQ67_03470 [Campylobacterales bacterium]|nr:hypothetical protein [Campylobacterales bacterium]